MPPMEPCDFLDEYIYPTLEAAWPDGLSEAILGSERHDQHWANALLSATLETANDAESPEPRTFEESDMFAFLRAWRERVIETLERRTARREQI
jgi:hypothetical protein